MIKMRCVTYLLCTTLVACSNGVNSKASEQHQEVSLKRVESANALHVFGSKSCLVSTDDYDSPKKESILTILGATLAQSAINSGLSAFSDYATKKATADTEGKTFTTTGVTHALTTTVVKNPNSGDILTKPILNIGCITIVKESKTPLNDSNWIKELEEITDTIDITETLQDEGINIKYVPSLFYQFHLRTDIDNSWYVAEPALLSYIERIGVSKSSDDMDLVLTVELSTPGAEDKPTHKFVFDYKNLKPMQVYTNKNKEFATQKAYPRLAADGDVKKSIKKAILLNTALANTKKQIEDIKLHVTEFCVGDKETDECKGYKKSVAEKNVALKIVQRDIENYINSYGDQGSRPSTLINMKASVTEVGDVNKFWQALAFASKELKEPVKTYVKSKYDDITDTYTTDEKIADSNNDINYLIASANFSKAKDTFKKLSSTDDGYIDAKVACYNALKSLKEAAYKVEKVATETCD